MINYKNLEIKAVYATVPEEIRDISKYYSTIFEPEKVNKFIKNVGVKEFRITNQDETSTVLALHSAKKLIEDLFIPRNEIGFLIFITQTPDYLLPSSSFFIQKELGLSNECNVFDINLGCSGYVSGLNTLFALMSNGSAKFGLLITGDTISKIVNQNDSATAMLFGDAGTATLVEKTNGKLNAFFSIQSLGNKFDEIIVESGMFKKPGEKILKMNGIEVFNFGINEVKNSINDHLFCTKNHINKYDYFIPHQANLFMINQLRKSLSLNLEVNTLSSIQNFGNTSVSSIPLTLAVNSNFNFENKAFLLSGFGVGFSIANLSFKSTSLQTKLFTYEREYK